MATGYRLRRARSGDLPTLIAHRLAMFTEIHDIPRPTLASHARVYRQWLRERLHRRELIAYVVEDRAGDLVASGGMWFQPTQPRVLMPKPASPYILSMYTRPADRHRGLASLIVRRLIADARRLGYPRVTLHASDMGRPVYERLGFEPTREMRLWLDTRIARHFRAPPRPTRRE